jgi:hypothetical protein
VSKIEISKAIHNGGYTPFLALLGGLTEQFVLEAMKRYIEQGQMTGYPLYAIH